MQDPTTELIQDLLSIYFTKRETPALFEVDTVERAVQLVHANLNAGTCDSYRYWVMKHKNEGDGGVRQGGFPMRDDDIFFNRLKQFMMRQDQIPRRHEYYFTLMQYQEELRGMAEDCARHRDYLIHYEPTDTSPAGRSHYHPGTIEIHLSTHRYLIELLVEDRFWGYCRCVSSQEDYNAEYRCCGDGCDWTAPRIRVKKQAQLLQRAFRGQAKDMWALERQWKEELQATILLGQHASAREGVEGAHHVRSIS